MYAACMQHVCQRPPLLLPLCRLLCATVPLGSDVGGGVQLKKPLKEAAVRKFGTSTPLVDRILELEIGVKAVVLGTLYKEMKVSLA